jgi:deoxycytidylate deaminase
MSAAEKVSRSDAPKSAPDSRVVIKGRAAHELFFAVVGPVGAGSSHVARQLARCIKSTRLGEVPFTCDILKAGEAIREWADKSGSPAVAQTSSIDTKILMQGYGDQMRSGGNHAALAVDLIRAVSASRARAQGKPYTEGEPVEPDGKPRAYILDSLKHPAEVQLLRRLYGHAFVLVGVVCSEPTRRARLIDGFFSGRERNLPENTAKVEEFMRRDADDVEHAYGQHVTDTFHEADFFVDNTLHTDQPASGDMKDAVDPRLIAAFNRLISMMIHQKIIRPTVDETAMHVAHTAKLRSSCLSRQVGAALIDRLGNVVATGTNEVPKAGGGVYGDSFVLSPTENRCAFCENNGNGAYCSNNYYQNELIGEALDALYSSDINEETKSAKLKVLRKTKLGGLLEFSRSVHAEMDALLSAGRSGVSTVGSRLFVTTFPCHFCARHIVTAGVYEVQYIEPYPKSQALALHGDAIETVPEIWMPPRPEPVYHDQRPQSEHHSGVTTNGEGANSEQAPTSIVVGKVPPGTGKVLFRPFVGVAPRLYPRVFLKDRDYKDKVTGEYRMGEAEWGSPWSQYRVSYARLEADLVVPSAS